jgi:hypothetical protein
LAPEDEARLHLCGRAIYLKLDRRENHTARTTTVLAVWHLSVHAILRKFSNGHELLKCAQAAHTMNYSIMKLHKPIMVPA